MIPTAHAAFGEDFTFQQDLSPIHTSRATKSFLNDCSLEVMNWPPRGADMNIIENAWGVIQAKVDEEPLAHNQDELWQQVLNAWNTVATDHQYWHSLQMSLPRRMAAVIRKRGE